MKTLWIVLGEGLPPSRYCTLGQNEMDIARVITTSVVHFAIDLVILIIPIPLVKMMRRKPSEKRFLFLMYSLGIIYVNIPPLSITNTYSSLFSSTLLFSTIRLYYLMKRLHDPGPEILHYSAISVMWSFIEINTSVIVVNLPTLMPIFDWCLESKKRVKDYLDKATRADVAIDGIVLSRRKSRTSISACEDDPENPQADDEDTYELESLAQRPSESSAEYGRQTLSLETTSSGSLREREHNTPFRVTNA